MQVQVCAGLLHVHDSRVGEPQCSRIIQNTAGGVDARACGSSRS